jgi:alpha-tubulin suppressor-like RCC1 family protein
MVAGDGLLFSWGDGINGKLGLGILEGDEFRTTPTQLTRSPANVIEISCGDFHSALLTGKLLIDTTF